MSENTAAAGRTAAADAVTGSPGLPPELRIEGRQAVITLRRPQVANRLDPDDLLVLLEQVRQVDAHEEVLVLRLQAQGRHFCSGFHIGEVEGGAAEAGRRFEALADAIERARPITVAALQGGLWGGATDLALACDFRWGTPVCEMSVPAARLGLLFYRGGLERYVRRLGPSVAKRVLLAAERFDAAAMQRIGYLDHLAPSVEALAGEVDAFCGSLAGMAPLALLGMKRHLDAIAAGRLDPAALAHDSAVCDASEDLREGARAWAEKRRPVFQGR